MAELLWVLVHSPLVGPFTWSAVAGELRRRGRDVVVPELTNRPEAQPYRQQHAAAVAEAVQAAGAVRPLVLVGHSGAGPQLPALRAAVANPVAAYLFVDAGLPADGWSRLDLFLDREEVARFRGAAVDGLLPPWGEEQLREELPDPDLRRHFLAELRPMPLAVYEEPLPVFAGWPDAPCAYLQFSQFYAAPAAEARRRGWTCRLLEAGHFHMLVDAAAVAAAMVGVVGEAPGRYMVR